MNYSLDHFSFYEDFLFLDDVDPDPMDLSISLFKIVRTLKNNDVYYGNLRKESIYFYSKVISNLTINFDNPKLLNFFDSHMIEKRSNIMVKEIDNSFIFINCKKK